MIPPPLALYVHVPWCIRKCPYCDFNSHVRPSALPESAYIDALLADLRTDLQRVEGRSLSSIFIGGGTPSLLSATAIGRLLQGVRDEIDCEPGLEVTLEANPGAVEIGDLAGYLRAGVNRLSLGVQSFHEDSLRALGRIHSAREASTAVGLARQAGFSRINLDLMFGLPGQDLGMAREDLQTALELEVEHLSYYQLTLEPNTAFHHAPPSLPDEDRIWEIQEQGHDLLHQAGYRQYEISAFSRTGAECRHNLNYWRFGDYLGIGAGAHAKLSHRDGRIERLWKLRHPDAYLGAAKGVYQQGGRELTSQDLLLEFFMNALRLTQGVERSLFGARTGLQEQAIQNPVSEAISKGLLESHPERLCATPLGQRFLNDLLMIFEVNEFS
ncbi:MAG: radical SAM family heme chaperone HemW [Candidatus Thiodiazotropha sp.]